MVFGGLFFEGKKQLGLTCWKTQVRDVSEDVFEVLSFPEVDQWGLDSDPEKIQFEVMHVFAIGLASAPPLDSTNLAPFVIGCAWLVFAGLFFGGKKQVGLTCWKVQVRVVSEQNDPFDLVEEV